MGGGGGSCLGTHVPPWWIHVNVWQNQYGIIKQNKVKIKKIIIIIKINTAKKKRIVSLTVGLFLYPSV